MILSTYYTAIYEVQFEHQMSNGGREYATTINVIANSAEDAITWVKNLPVRFFVPNPLVGTTVKRLDILSVKKLSEPKINGVGDSVITDDKRLREEPDRIK